MNEALRELISHQEGMVARRQLTAHGVDWDHVDHQIAARRWAVRTPRVISTITGELTREQRLWLAVLHAGPRSMLGGLTAAEQHGLAGWEREAVTVDDELSFEPVDGIHFFRCRRPFALLRSRKPGFLGVSSNRRCCSGRGTTPRSGRRMASSPRPSSSA